MKKKIVMLLLITLFIGIFCISLKEVNNTNLNYNFIIPNSIESPLNESDSLLYDIYWNNETIKNSFFSNQIAYLACGSNGFIILNLSDPNGPQEINRIYHDDFYFEDFVISDNILYCYNHTQIILFNVSSLDQPVFITEYSNFSYLFGFNVEEKIGYLSCAHFSNYVLEILNITDPLNITIISSFYYHDNQIYAEYQDIIENSNNLTILSSTHTSQVYFLNKTNLLNITKINILNCHEYHILSDFKVLAINYSTGIYNTDIHIYDINDIENITLISTLSCIGYLSFNFQIKDQLFFSDKMEIDYNEKIVYNNWYNIYGEIPLIHIYQLNDNNQLSLNRTINLYPIYHPISPINYHDFYFQRFVFLDVQEIFSFKEIAYFSANSELYIASFDCDFDMLPSFMEKSLELNDTNPDCDNDFLDDGLEYFIYKTGIMNYDSDNDKYSDGLEIYYWKSNPLDNQSKPSLFELALSYNFHWFVICIFLLSLIYLPYFKNIINYKENLEKKKLKTCLQMIFRFINLGLFLGFTIPFLFSNIIVSHNSYFICEIKLNGNWIEYLSENPTITFGGIGSDLGSYNTNITIFAYLAFGFLLLCFLLEIIIIPLKTKTNIDKIKIIYKRILDYKNFLILLGFIFALVSVSLLLEFFLEINRGINSQFNILEPLFFTLNWSFWSFIIILLLIVIYLILQLTSWIYSTKKKNIKKTIFLQKSLEIIDSINR